MECHGFQGSESSHTSFPSCTPSTHMCPGEAGPHQSPIPACSAPISRPPGPRICPCLSIVKGINLSSSIFHSPGGSAI